MMDEKHTCKCNRPDIYSRHNYCGAELQSATAYCKNCNTNWVFNIKTKKWCHTDTTRKVVNNNDSELQKAVLDAEKYLKELTNKDRNG